MLQTQEQKKDITSMFVDDILGLAKTLADMQVLLNDAQEWAVLINMHWNISKSWGLKMNAKLRMNGERLPDNYQPT